MYEDKQVVRETTTLHTTLVLSKTRQHVNRVEPSRIWQSRSTKSKQSLTITNRLTQTRQDMPQRTRTKQKKRKQPEKQVPNQVRNPTNKNMGRCICIWPEFFLFESVQYESGLHSNT